MERLQRLNWRAIKRCVKRRSDEFKASQFPGNGFKKISFAIEVCLKQNASGRVLWMDSTLDGDSDGSKVELWNFQILCPREIGKLSPLKIDNILFWLFDPKIVFLFDALFLPKIAKERRGPCTQCDSSLSSSRPSCSQSSAVIAVFKPRKDESSTISKRESLDPCDHRATSDVENEGFMVVGRMGDRAMAVIAETI
ncbi:hypothetical protein SCHPADRAFT_894723 [Schizopora paradoxa]|uniref:Uncharacterized protein n=1 Tax=Schizopora paradoxa TaxID=27342 RepID=A0A0H2R7M7_9AGAM|nr:hypothetical protein SCHPADRAFT_894723 [Schizopora paradoxa]